MRKGCAARRFDVGRVQLVSPNTHQNLSEPSRHHPQRHLGSGSPSVREDELNSTWL